MTSEQIEPALPPHFTAIAPLGRGSAAVVWRATYLVTGQEVAVKVWHRPLVDDAERQRFVNECHWHALLSAHPNIVGWVWASSPDEPNPWIATVPHGVSLSAWRRAHGRPTVDMALRIALDLLAGLAEVHALSLVHRDVNPNNILVDQQGRAALCDLGIAMSVERVTREYAAGTPGYVAPELRSGVEAPSFSSDVYSAAIVISELLGEDAPWQIDHLVNAVARSHRPSDRPTDAADFRQRLRAAMQTMETEPVIPPTMMAPSPAPPAGTSRRRRASIVGGAALLAVGCAVGYAQMTGGVGLNVLRGLGSETKAPASPGGEVRSSGPTSPPPAGASPAASVNPAGVPVPASAPPLTDGAVVAVVNADTGQCVDLPGTGSGAVDGVVQQHGCRTGVDDNQRWRALRAGGHNEGDPAGTGYPRYLLQNVNDRLCLDLPGYGSVSSGTAVSEYYCRRTDDNQLFYLRPQAEGGNTALVNEVSGLCLTVPEASDRQDTALVVADCDGRSGQSWGFR